MKRLKKVGYGLVGAAGALTAAAPAFAGLDLSKVTIDTHPIFQLAGIIVGAIASIWAIKKVVKLANRS